MLAEARSRGTSLYLAIDGLRSKSRLRREGSSLWHTKVDSLRPLRMRALQTQQEATLAQRTVLPCLQCPRPRAKAATFPPDVNHSVLESLRRQPLEKAQQRLRLLPKISHDLGQRLRSTHRQRELQRSASQAQRRR